MPFCSNCGMSRTKEAKARQGIMEDGGWRWMSLLWIELVRPYLLGLRHLASIPVTTIPAFFLVCFYCVFCRNLPSFNQPIIPLRCVALVLPPTATHSSTFLQKLSSSKCDGVGGGTPKCVHIISLWRSFISFLNYQSGG